MYIRLNTERMKSILFEGATFIANIRNNVQDHTNDLITKIYDSLFSTKIRCNFVVLSSSTTFCTSYVSPLNLVVDANLTK